ncbi:Protein bicaudal C 1 [Blattella germanica]|nr:Protein bicaudal C 1 [Blattella germanica]
MSMHSEQKASDNMSEISDGGTGGGTSVSGQDSIEGSNENLRELAMELGLSGVDELYEERFRVDRRKLEHMILGDEQTLEHAESFFQKIMTETRTHIMWPSRLKIGAKSKKDPHVRVAGRQDDVKLAKDKVMEVLDTRSNRVTMKLDVSYTDHSHIIGKGGLTIKRVMEETGCHIHFPDSNRNNLNEKSNQVSIAGELVGVEQARGRIRNLTPVVFTFELPIVGTMMPLADNNSQYLKNVQEKYNVHVMFRNRPKLYGTMVVVKGCEWEVDSVKEATILVMHHLCESLANQVVVQMTLEISPQHHNIVLGKNGANLKLIMQRTSTQIMFPDATDPNIPSLKKSNFSITGNIHKVYLARQQLMGSLPIVLMFDLPEDVVVDTDQVSRLMQALDVFISIRHKAKQSITSVIIKGIERNAKMYGNAGGRGHPYLRINTNCVTLPTINLPPMHGGNSPPFPSPVSSVGNPWSNGFSSPTHTPISINSMLHPPMLPQASLNHLLNLPQQQQPLLVHRSISPNMSTASNAGSISSSGYGSNRNLGPYASNLSLASDIKDSNESRVELRRESYKEASGTDSPTCNNNLIPSMYQNGSEYADGNTLSASNYLDSTPSSTVNRITGLKITSLEDLLITLQLEKYIHNFTSHEIDLATFASLNEKDLREIGVSALGARRKMLVAISELNKRQNQFCGSAAPGAERKASTSAMVGSSSIVDSW